MFVSEVTGMVKDLYRQSRPRFLLAVVAGLASGISGAGLAAIMSRGASRAAPLHTLAMIFFALCLLQLVFKAGSQLLLMTAAQDMIYRLRIELCRKVLLTPLRKLQSFGQARLLAILTADISTFSQASQLMPAILGDGIAVLVCLGYIAWISPQIFACVALLLLLGGSTYYFVERWPRRRMREVRDQLDAIYRHFRSLLEGTRELQLNAARADDFIERLVSPAARQFRTLFVRGMAAYTLVNSGGNTLFYLSIGLLLLVAPTWLPQQSGTMTTLMLLLLYLMQPVGEVMSALPNLRQSSIARARILQLEVELSQSGDPRVSVPPGDPFAQPLPATPLLKLSEVYHQFPGLTEDKPFMLGPINLSIEPGELLFVVGANGSGKTTLAMILLGLYAPERGHVELNGIAVDRSNLAQYRQHFSAVFADFHLFDEILCIDQPEVAEQAANYLNALGLAHKVKVESGKYTTTSLSSGQRKRMALISSYLEDRPIYLFDEWAADQDPSFKRVFYTELLPELKRRGKTVIVISHDDAYFQHSDRIVKLSEGVMTVGQS